MRATKTFEIGNVQLDPGRCQLTGPAGRARLEPRVADVAACLVRQAGVVVSRDALVDSVWQGYPGADHSLTSAISKLRRALADAGGDAAAIETVPKRGYRVRQAGSTLPVSGDETPAALAVLPFRNLGNDPGDDFLCEGLAEELLNALMRVPSLRIAARTSSFALARRRVSLKELGAQLDVSHVLEGSVRRVGDRLRVRVGMLDVATETQRWSREFEQDWRDLLEVQDSITATVLAEALGSVGTRHHADTSGDREPGPDAFMAFLKGRYFWYRENTDPGKAFDYFHRAIELDPDFAAPYAGLVDCYCTYGVWQLMSQDKARSRALDYAEQALALAPDSADVQFSHGYAQFYARWRWHSAERSMRRALDINPRHILAHSFLGLLCAVQGRDDEAAQFAQQLVTLDPLSSWCWYFRGLISYYLRDFEDAAASTREALELDPNELFALWIASSALGHLGRSEEALPLAKRLEEGSAVVDIFHGCATSVYAICGARQDAERALAELERRDSEGGVSPLVLSFTWAALGREQPAIRALQAAFEEHNMAMFYVSREPFVDAIRAQPAFKAILRELGLPGGTIHPGMPLNR